MITENKEIYSQQTHVLNLLFLDNTIYLL